MPVKVHMFVLNNFTRDTRVLREARALTGAGYEVTVFALLDAETQPRETIEGIRVVRLRPNNFLQFPFSLYERLFERPTSHALRWLSKREEPLGAISQSPSNGTPVRRGLNGQVFVAPKREEQVDPCRRIYRHLRATVAGNLIVRRTEDFGRKCHSVIHKSPADVYHAHDLPTLPIACRAARKFGGKVVYDSHELYLECGHTAPLVRHWRRVEEQLIHRADAVFTVCDSIGEELQQRYGVPMPTILRNCCEATTTRIGEDLTRAATGIASHTPVVLYQGGFAHGRGLTNLIRATHYIDDAAVVFMGWGAVESELKSRVRAEGLQDRIYFIPPAPQSELLSWSAGAEVGVIPYQAVRLNNFYSCPNKLFEYINAGIAVAASGFPELARIIETYQVGRTFDPESPEDIGRTVNEMLHDRDALAQMQRNSQAAARQLNWRVESEKLVSTYRNLLT